MMLKNILFTLCALILFSKPTFQDEADLDEPIQTVKFIFKCTQGTMLSAVRAISAEDESDVSDVQVQASCQEPPVLCGTSNGDPIPAEKWTENCVGKTACDDTEFLNGFDYGGEMYCCKYPRECHSSGTTKRYTLFPQSSIKFNPRRRKGQSGEREWQQAILRDLVAISSNERRIRQIFGHAPPIYYLVVDEVPGIVVLAPVGHALVQHGPQGGPHGPPTPGQALSVVPCGTITASGCPSSSCSSNGDCKSASCSSGLCGTVSCGTPFVGCYGSSVCTTAVSCCSGNCYSSGSIVTVSSSSSADGVCC